MKYVGWGLFVMFLTLFTVMFIFHMLYRRPEWEWDDAEENLNWDEQKK